MAWCVEAWRGVLRGCGMVCVGFGEGWEDLSGCAMGLRECREGVAWCGMVLGGYGMTWVLKDDI